MLVKFVKPLKNPSCWLSVLNVSPAYTLLVNIIVLILLFPIWLAKFINVTWLIVPVPEVLLIVSSPVTLLNVADTFVPIVFVVVSPYVMYQILNINIIIIATINVKIIFAFLFFSIIFPL